MHLNRFLLLLGFILLVGKAGAQSDSIKIVETKKMSITAYPVLFYLPETRWGVGAASVVTFRLPGEGP